MTSNIALVALLVALGGIAVEAPGSANPHWSRVGLIRSMRAAIRSGSRFTRIVQGHKPRPLPSGDLGLIAVRIQALCKNYRDKLSHPDINKLDKYKATTTLNQMIETISSIVLDAKNGVRV